MDKSTTRNRFTDANLTSVIERPTTAFTPDTEACHPNCSVGTDCAFFAFFAVLTVLQASTLILKSEMQFIRTRTVTSTLTLRAFSTSELTRHNSFVHLVVHQH